MPSDVTPKAQSDHPWPEPAIERLEELTGVELRKMELVDFVRDHPDAPDFLLHRYGEGTSDWEPDWCTQCGQPEPLLTPDGYCRLCLAIEFGYWRANRTYTAELLELALERARDDDVDVAEFVAEKVTN